MLNLNLQFFSEEPDNTGDNQNQNQGEKTFTQAELDKIIQERLAKEKAKHQKELEQLNSQSKQEPDQKEEPTSQNGTNEELAQVLSTVKDLQKTVEKQNEELSSFKKLNTEVQEKQKLKELGLGDEEIKLALQVKGSLDEEGYKVFTQKLAPKNTKLPQQNTTTQPLKSINDILSGK